MMSRRWRTRGRDGHQAPRERGCARSGGLARWLATAPELLILDEPTRGIDVGAKADIQRKVAELAEKGLSVVFISSELAEVLRIAQRVAVLRDRRKIGELATRDVDLDGLVTYIAEGQPETTSSDREKIA